MKKIGFALQVFSLAAMLPLCVVLEMRHTTSRLKENGVHAGIPEKKEKTSFLLNSK